jgi:putative oligomerization/nucleic acid binding protein
LCLASAGFASSAPSAPVSLGNNTYSITCEASNAFQRDVDKLKAEATDAANNFCAQQGKQMKQLSLTGKLPFFSTGYAKAKIVFMALNPGDPELTMPVTPEGTIAPAAVMAPAPLPRLSTDELYSELVKLDDLRKKGILSDDEFQAEKKKLLSRSN